MFKKNNGETDEFVQNRAGLVNIQQATISVELDSTTEAEQFLALLTGSNDIFNLSIKLNWKTTWAFLQELCQEIADTGTVTLEIDGVTLDIVPQGHIQYARNLFGDVVLRETNLRFFTLLNYPSTAGAVSLCRTDFATLEIPASTICFQWLDLINIIATRSLYIEQDAQDHVRTTREIKSALVQSGLSGVTKIALSNVYHNNKISWIDIFDLEEQVFVEVYSKDMVGDNDVLLSGSLRKLTVHLEEHRRTREVSHTLQANPILQKLNVSYSGHNVLRASENILKTWIDFSIASRLMLIDRMADSQGRIIAQLVRRRGLPRISARQISNKQEPLLFEGIKFLHWDCDEISFQLDDYSASLLDTATQHHPSALTLFTLDVNDFLARALHWWNAFSVDPAWSSSSSFTPQSTPPSRILWLRFS